MRVLLMLLIVAGPAAAAPLGRLFFTPEERTLLDAPQPAAAAGPAATPRLDGIAHSRSGRRTVWLDGEAQTPADGWHADRRGRLRIVAPDAPPRDLLVGDDLAIGIIRSAAAAPAPPGAQR